MAEILEEGTGGFGATLDAAISLCEEEKTRLVDAWVYTFIRPKS